MVNQNSITSPLAKRTTKLLKENKNNSVPKYKKQKTKTKMDEVTEMMSKTFTTRVNSTPVANTNKFKVAKKSVVLTAAEVPSPVADLMAIKLKKNSSLIPA